MLQLWGKIESFSVECEHVTVNVAQQRLLLETKISQEINLEMATKFVIMPILEVLVGYKKIVQIQVATVRNKGAVMKYKVASNCEI